MLFSPTIEGDRSMKYMLMMNTPGGGPYQIASWPQKDIEAHIAFMSTSRKKLSAAGELVGAEGLSGPDQAKLVRAGARRRADHRRRLPRVQGVPGGLLDRRRRDAGARYAIAAEASAAPGPGGKPLNMPIEVRQVMSGPPSRLDAVIPRLDNSAQDLLRDLAPQVLGVLAPPLSRLRRLRGRGAGSAHRRGDAVADPGHARQPAGLADHASRRAGSPIRSAPTPRGAARAAGGEPDSGRRADRARCRRRRRQRAGRNARPLLHVLPSGAVAGVAGRADAARGRRPDDGEIARAFFVPEATMAQRLTRAKQTHQVGRRGLPELHAPPIARPPAGRAQVLYLDLQRGLHGERRRRALRASICRAKPFASPALLDQLLPDDPEVGGLLALMLLTDARRAARTGPNGELIPLDEQVRIALGPRGDRGRRRSSSSERSREARIGPYQIQAAIAALHDEAPSTRRHRLAADRRALRLCCFAFDDSPMVALSHAIALAMVDGPAAGSPRARRRSPSDPRIATHHRLDAARAHLLERAGDHAEAIELYRRAAERTTSTPERNYLLLHAARLAETGSSGVAP